MDTDRAGDIGLLYSENCGFARANLEVRFKVLTNFLVGLGGLFLLLRWMQSVPSLRAWAFVPFVLGGAYASMCGMMSIINGRILRDAWTVAERLERRIDPDGGFFAQSNLSYQKRITYNTLLVCLYFGAGIVLLAVGSLIAWVRS